MTIVARTRNRIAFLLILPTALLLPSVEGPPQRDSGQEQATLEASYCELAKNPAAFDRKQIRLTAFLAQGFENFTLSMPDCDDKISKFSLWATYGGTAQTGIIYCCPGEAGVQSRQRPLSVDGLKVPLQDDQVFRSLTALLRKELDTVVRVSVVGKFLAGTKEVLKDRTWWRGYGHLGCCSLLIIERVEKFEPHDKNHVDYTAEAGWYEEEGCKWEIADHLRHVSISFPDEEAKKAILEQQQADAGPRSWAFSDAERVAVESLQKHASTAVGPLKRDAETPGRQVFRARTGKTAFVVVVTRPYWLSFYSRNGSVVWVATTIKQANCR